MLVGYCIQLPHDAGQSHETRHISRSIVSEWFGFDIRVAKVIAFESVEYALARLAPS